MQLLGLLLLAEPLPFEVSGDVAVYAAPSTQAGLRGRIPDGSVALALEQPHEGPGCTAWAAVEGGGFACLDRAAPTERWPSPLPVLFAFDPPTPEEYAGYLADGTWDRASPEALLPYVYGRRYRSWEAPVYESPEAYAEGEPPLSHLGSIRKFHFVGVVETPKGEVLLRPDGSVVPVEEVYLYPISRLAGRDLERSPVPEGWLVGWSVAAEGAPVHAEPRADAEVYATLPYHGEGVLRRVDQDWWELRGLGFVEASKLRVWIPAPAPESIGAEELWVDVDREEQVLALRRGEALLYVTLVSTGRPLHRTPLGLFRMQRKYVATDMSSGPGAAEPYYVEKVPWAMFYYGGYALHGVFWHWGFGHVASHGCINLTPQDAHYLFDRLLPDLPAGWDTVYADQEHPGSTLRVRVGSEPVPDRR